MISIKVRNEGNDYTITPAGRLDAFSAAEAERVFAETAEKAEHITLECSRLIYVSGEGLRVINGLRLAMEEKGGRLAVRNVLPEVMEVFKIAGFTELFSRSTP